jgi:GNAT superfamily N-acetyltransferase
VKAFDLRAHDGQETAGLVEELADAYIAAYADDPDIGRSIYARDAFVRRTSRQTGNDGFVLVTAHEDNALAGFAFGFTFAAGRWWASESEAPPDELLSGKTFAVIELVVMPEARGLGLATRLMEALTGDRHEPWATLLADQEGHAREIYRRWGWKRTSTLRPAADVPELDVLVRRL